MRLATRSAGEVAKDAHSQLVGSDLRLAEEFAAVPLAGRMISNRGTQPHRSVPATTTHYRAQLPPRAGPNPVIACQKAPVTTSSTAIGRPPKAVGGDPGATARLYLVDGAVRPSGGSVPRSHRA
ncbi:hypothetical protein B8W66_00330 [Mycobacterium decipiens]|uniref:Uncharacterized protein n=1 Tax=Mycobacterium decipiens TaxID=1430326 RepID=A0A1X2M045_9MYCO|nr:hypothetical protein B8W66_00330 [Mycobacterium decipiens]